MLYFVEIMFIASVALYFATISKTYLFGMLSTFGVYILYNMLAILDKAPVIKYFPGMIKLHISELIYGVHNATDLSITVVFTISLTVLFLFLAIVKMRKSDI